MQYKIILSINFKQKQGQLVSLVRQKNMFVEIMTFLPRKCVYYSIV